jgi:predicted Rossmann-fold nucleotide-binding protein
MPQVLIDREVGHKGLTEMHIAQTMHERKALMAELADGFYCNAGRVWHA